MSEQDISPEDQQAIRRQAIRFWHWFIFFFIIFSGAILALIHTEQTQPNTSSIVVTMVVLIASFFVALATWLLHTFLWAMLQARKKEQSFNK